MKIQPVKLKNLKIVPENVVLDCAGQFVDEENIFKLSIQQALEFKMAGLTPVYMCNEACNTLYVTSKECLNKEYN